MMTEKEFWEEIREAWKHKCHIINIEATTLSGVPDTNICYAGKEVWLELKVLRQRNTILMGIFQPPFHLKRNHHGGNCFVLVRAVNGIGLYEINKDIKVVPIKAMKKVSVQLSDLKQHKEWIKPFDWNEMLEEIMELSN